MRLGIDASNLVEGGGRTHLRELLAATDPARHRVESITIWGSERTLNVLPARDHVRLVRIPAARHLAARLWWQRRELHKQAAGCDVLFVPGGTYLGPFRPFVTMSRNLLPFDPVERRRYGLSLRRLRYVGLEASQAATFNRAAAIVFLTRIAQETVQRRTGRSYNRTAVIPHGVGDEFRRAARLQVPIAEYSPERPFRWLYVSIVNWYKHQWHVAAAVAMLRARGVPVELQMVGPAYEPALRRLRTTIRSLDPEGRYLRYDGPTSYDRLPALYAAADGVVVASSCETFGQVLVEAMASGMPIACSNRSALPEVLDGAGELFDPEDPQDIARAMTLLLEDAGRRQRAAESAVDRAARYSWRATADATFSLLADVAAQHAQAAHA